MQSTAFGRSRSAIVAVALAIATLLFAYAHSSGVGEATPTPFSSQSSEAEAAILRTDLGGRMEAALGDAFGGVWFDQATAQMHVGVISAADRRLAEQVAERAGLAGVVTETEVDSTWAELEAAQSRLNDHLDDLFERGEVTTSAAPDLNSVRVELGSAVTGRRRAALERAAAATGVDVSISAASAPRLVAASEARCKVFVTFAAHCDKPIVAGVTIESESKAFCTAGPAALLQDLSTAEKSTATYILTAGHCGPKGEKWYAYTKGGVRKLIGESVESIHGLAVKFDVQAIKVNNPGEWANAGEIPVIPSIAPWNAAAEVEPFPVTAQLPKPMKGAKVCVSGQTSGTSCGGLVEEPSVTKTFEPGGTTVEKLVEVKNTTTGGGTSGGPWFSETAPGEVYGTHVGAEVGGNQRKFFQLLEVSFGVLATKLKLLTTANEKRKHP